MMATSTSIPAPAKRLILAVGASGAVILATQVPFAATWSLRDAISCLVLAVLITVLEQFPIHVRFRTETFNMSMTDAVWTAGLLLVKPSVLLLAVGAGAVAGQFLRRRQLHKATFNVGQYMLAVGSGVLVYVALGSPSAQSSTGWIVAAVAMAVCFLVNALAVALVVALVERKSVLTILAASFGVNVSHWICNTSTGILGAVLWTAEPRALVFLVAPLVLSYFAYRSWVDGVRERDRMRNLYEAGRTLFAPIEADADFRPFLGLVERMLEATRVELIVAEDDRLTVHASDGRVSKANLPIGGGMSESLQTYLDSSSAPYQVKVIGSGDDVRGFLIVYRAAQPPTRSRPWSTRSARRSP